MCEAARCRAHSEQRAKNKLGLTALATLVRDMHIQARSDESSAVQLVGLHFLVNCQCPSDQCALSVRQVSRGTGAAEAKLGQSLRRRHGERGREIFLDHEERRAHGLIAPVTPPGAAF